MATLLLNPQVSAPPQPPPHAATPVTENSDLFRLERGLALMLIMVAAVYLRARDPLYNTAFMDESIYVVYGRMFLAHHFEGPLSTPLQWSFGWYLWPVIAALTDRVGGLLALREMAALLGTLTVAATYGFASRVFSKTVGLGSAAVMALLAPAVLVSRIATRDSGSICFFALGLWAFAAAWQTGKKRGWVFATICLFAAFLCKYLVAIYFPVLALLALWKGKKPFILFVAPLSAACGSYAFLNWSDLTHLLHYGSAYNSLRAPDAFSIYVLGRLDLALVAWLALLALAAPQWRGRAAWMWAGALIALLFQWQTRADYDFWKHANYALLFLVPAAVAAVLFLTRQIFNSSHMKQLQWGTAGVLSVAICAGLLGKVHRIDQFIFWPNVSPALAFFEANGNPQDRVLVDDTVFRYYLNPALDQTQIVDPMYFAYTDSSGDNIFGEDAYKAAVSSRAFSYIVLDGGMGEEAHRMDAAIQPFLANYHLQMRASDPIRGHDIEIYSREPETERPADPGRPSIHLLSPATAATVNAEDTMADGVVTGAQPGWYVRLEVFTDRWYPQGEAVPIANDGSFRQAIRLAGVGRQQCFHLVRARLLNNTGQSQAIALNDQISRLDGEGSCSAKIALNAVDPGRE